MDEVDRESPLFAFMRRFGGLLTEQAEPWSCGHDAFGVDGDHGSAQHYDSEQKKQIEDWSALVNVSSKIEQRLAYREDSRVVRLRTGKLQVIPLASSFAKRRAANRVSEEWMLLEIEALDERHLNG